MSERLCYEDCDWTEDEEGVWRTDCEHTFVLNEGTPSDNEMLFCCFCGRELIQNGRVDNG